MTNRFSVKLPWKIRLADLSVTTRFGHLFNGFHLNYIANGPLYGFSILFSNLSIFRLEQTSPFPHLL